MKGEIITSAFTWVATVSAIKWEACTPIFCDIDPETLNIDVNDEKCTEKTVAIMPVHVFGNPCDVDAMKKLLKNTNLKLFMTQHMQLDLNTKGKAFWNVGIFQQLVYMLLN